MNLKNIAKNLYFGLRGFFLRIIASKSRKAMPHPHGVRSILMIRIDRIGDLVVSLPAMMALRNVFADAEVSVLTTESNASLLGLCPWVNEVIVYRGLIRTLPALRRKNFDLAVDFLMDYPLKPALLARFSKAKFTAGFAVAGKGSCFSLKFVPSAVKKHVSLYMLDLVREIASVYGGKAPSSNDAGPLFSIQGEDKEYVEALLRDNGISRKDIVVIMHPGGHYATQQWPAERFARLGDILTERYDAKIILLGSSREEKLVRGLSSLMRKKPLVFAGLPLDKLAMAISRADLFIGNNSGPWHIACELGIPTVSTMGPTNPVLWRPRAPGHIVIRKGLSCSPCDKAKCPGLECMRQITLEEMLQAAEQQLGRGGYAGKA